MFPFRHPILAALLATSAIVTIALCWFGWRTVLHEGAAETQRLRDEMDHRADAIAAGIQSRLAEVGDQLSRWVSSDRFQPPAVDGAVIFAVRDGSIEVAPKGALPFVPVAVPVSPLGNLFAAAEALEFRGREISRAAQAYRMLSRHSDARVQAEAQMRLGRVLRKTREFARAIDAYRSLASAGDIQVGGLPAGLVGLEGQRLALEAAGERDAAQRLASQIAHDIDGGRWALTRGAAEFYREAVTDRPRPESWLLAEALAAVWGTPLRDGASGGGIDEMEMSGRPVLILHRSNGPRSMALVAFADRIVAGQIPPDCPCQLVDVEGRRLAGAASVPAQAVGRVIGDARNPWMLKLWPDGASKDAPSRMRPALLLAMLAVVILFLWGTVYFMARAIRREAAASRLQSDFVAAVSHEFRSPLTTVRQLSEMLEMGQVPGEERRQRYYRLLVGEARRLQRLVETLLDCGKMEAGAQQYRFERLAAAALVERGVVEASVEEGSASRIRVDGPGHDVWIKGDAESLALALRNLIDNALKYSPAGEQVEVRWTASDGRLSISVTDRGPGIPREEQEVIFRKFVRGRAAIEASVKGTGVGLAMVRHIVTAHDAEIRLESQLGQGSTFTIVLPVWEGGS